MSGYITHDQCRKSGDEIDQKGIAAKERKERKRLFRERQKRAVDAIQAFFLRSLRSFAAIPLTSLGLVGL
jgi:hypothetical protein